MKKRYNIIAEPFISVGKIEEEAKQKESQEENKEKSPQDSKSVHRLLTQYIEENPPGKDLLNNGEDEQDVCTLSPNLHSNSRWKKRKIMKMNEFLIFL